jgi:hypothetical protein
VVEDSAATAIERRALVFNGSCSDTGVSGQCGTSTMPDDATPPAVTYGTYLEIEELLSVQQPRSSEHNEMLFIVIHQVYELAAKRRTT